MYISPQATISLCTVSSNPHANFRNLKMPKAKTRQSTRASSRNKEKQATTTTGNIKVQFRRESFTTGNIDDSPANNPGHSEWKPLTDVRLRVKTKEEYRIIRQKKQRQKGVDNHPHSNSSPQVTLDTSPSERMVKIKELEQKDHRSTIKPRIKMRLKWEGSADAHGMFLMMHPDLNCSNSPHCTKGNALHNCIYPPYREISPRVFKCKGQVHFEPKDKGNYFILNQSFLQAWGISFYLKEEERSISVTSWRNAERNYTHSATNYRLTFYGKNTHEINIIGDICGPVISIPKKRIPIRSHVKYKLKIKN